MEFSRQDSWSGLPFPFPGDLPGTGIEPGSPALAGGFFTAEPQGNLCISVALGYLLNSQKRARGILDTQRVWNYYRVSFMVSLKAQDSLNTLLSAGCHGHKIAGGKAICINTMPQWTMNLDAVSLRSRRDGAKDDVYVPRCVMYPVWPPSTCFQRLVSPQM